MKRFYVTVHINITEDGTRFPKRFFDIFNNTTFL